VTDAPASAAPADLPAGGASPPSTSPPSTHGHDWAEIAATVLLALAAVATAWSSYQASRWNGEQAAAASKTNALRIEAARAQGLAEGETQVDVAVFIQWTDAFATNDPALASFYEARFRKEFRPAFDAWIATDPFVDPAAPLTPFAMPEYRLEAKQEAARLDQRSAASAAKVQLDIQRSTKYVLAVVLFSVALFFAGISTKLVGRNSRVTLVGFGYVVFLAAVTWVATFPVTIAV
jgi:hypothetical protein